jgi:hypothetical protein
MPKTPVKRVPAKFNAPVTSKGVNHTPKARVEKTLASVHTSMAVEGLKPSKVTVALGKEYLDGKISAQEAISRIKAKHLSGSNRHT